MEGNFKTLTALAKEVERQEMAKWDPIVRDSHIKMVDDNFIGIKDINKDYGKFSMTDVAHNQLCHKLHIPKDYYQEMLKVPGLRSHNVNTLLSHNMSVGKSSHLIRIIDNKARAFLTTGFKPVDHAIILSTFIPIIQEIGIKGVDVKSCSITDRKLYLQVVFPKLEGEVNKGDVVQYGITLTNSEVGCGAFNVKSFVYRLICKNGAIGENILSKFHVGRKIKEDSFENIHESIFKEDTIKADLESFRLQLRDVLQHSVSEGAFQMKLAKMQQASKDKVVLVSDTIKNVGKKFGLDEKEQDLVLNNLVKEKDATRWAVANSVTALAHDFDNQDRQYEYERIGDDIIELSSNQWEVMTTTKSKKSRNSEE